MKAQSHGDKPTHHGMLWGGLLGRGPAFGRRGGGRWEEGGIDCIPFEEEAGGEGVFEVEDVVVVHVSAGVVVVVVFAAAATAAVASGGALCVGWVVGVCGCDTCVCV